MPRDKVHPLKMESPGSGGTQLDDFPSALNPQEDHINTRGVILQNDVSNDEAVGMERTNSEMVLRDSAAGPRTLSSLIGGAGVTIEDEGTAVPNSPHAILDFVGAGVTVTDKTGGRAEVNIPGSAGGKGVGFIWGNKDVGSSSATTRFLDPGFTLGDAARVAPAVSVPSPVAGTLKNLHVTQNKPGTSAVKTLTYTVQINGVDTSVVVTMAENATTVGDVTNTAAVAKGDLITIKVTKSADSDQKPEDVVASLEIA